MKKLLGCKLILASLIAAWTVTVLAAGPTSKVVQTGEFSVKQFVTPGFADLPLDRRIFASYLADAIEAGRDIAWRQQGEYGLPIRHLFEKIWRKRSQLTQKEIESLEPYYFNLLTSHGIYNRTANTKFVLEGLSAPEFTSTLKRLNIPEPSTEILKVIFDRNFKQHAIAPRGQDLISASGVDFYGPGMNQERFDQLSQGSKEHFFSYPVWNDLLGVTEVQYHRIGGRFSEDLKAIDRALEQAEAYANPEEKNIISLYRKVLRTGDPQDQLAADRAWVQGKTADLVFNIGFTETYDDPLQIRGTWQGFILLLSKDAESERRAAQIRAAAGDFESRMPVDPEFIKRGKFTPPNSDSAHILYAGGGSNEMAFSGVNLPNDNHIRATLGSRSFTATNKVTDIGKAAGEEYLKGELEIFYLPRYFEQLREFGQTLPYIIQTELHEVLGHGSGKARDGVDPSAALGSYFAAMEEARAELGALYHILDAAAIEKHKILPLDWPASKRKAFAETLVLQFFTKHLYSLERLQDATEIRQAHQLGRHLIFTEMVRKGVVQVIVSNEGIPRIQLGKIDDLRARLGEFWGRVQRLKSTGDEEGLREMTIELGKFTEDQRAWAKNIKAAFDKLGRSEFHIYISPKLRRVMDRNSQIVDVVQEYLPSGGDLSKLFDFEQLRACENLLL